MQQVAGAGAAGSGQEAGGTWQLELGTRLLGVGNGEVGGRRLRPAMLYVRRQAKTRACYFVGHKRRRGCLLGRCLWAGVRDGEGQQIVAVGLEWSTL